MTENGIDFKKVKSKVENVMVRGLSKTQDDYVKAQIGDMFKATNFDDILNLSTKAKERLARLNCFKSIEVIIDESLNKKEHNYDIIFNVEELNNFTGGIHTSIGNNDGSLISTLSLPNMYGKGEKLSAEYSYGTRNQNDSRLSYWFPIGLDPSKNISISLFRSSNEFSWSKNRQEDAGVSIDLTTPFEYMLGKDRVVKGSHILSYEGTWRNLLSNHDATFDIRENSGHTLKSSFKYTNLIDRRNHNNLPTKGGYLKNVVELAGLGGDTRFFKLDSTYLYTKTLLKYFTMQFSFAKGVMVPFNSDDKIQVNDRFFLGGPLSMRGFANRGAGPHKEDCSLGNDAYWLCGLHMYTPLPFLHKNKNLSSWFKTHSFINVGNIFSFKHLS